MWFLDGVAALLWGRNNPPTFRQQVIDFVGMGDFVFTNSPDYAGLTTFSIFGLTVAFSITGLQATGDYTLDYSFAHETVHTVSPVGIDLASHEQMANAALSGGQAYGIGSRGRTATDEIPEKGRCC